MIGTYDGTYYNAAMGVFGYVVNATIKNLTIDNFSCESEFGTAGVVANCADGVCYFENIAIINCAPYTYNNNCAGVLATDGGDEGNEFYFKNITIDNTNTIGALWGTWDGICAGIMCSLKAGTKVEMENCHVAAKLDVYNDVCGNYQYYWYRFSGMLIGRVRNTVEWNGYDIPDLKNVTAKNCTVNFGDWNDYYYCEIEANTQASYTEDYQMSRLTKVKSVEGNLVTYLDDTTETITGEGYCHFVVVPDSANPENAICHHFKDGEVYNHTVNEDKQHVYLPFNQLFTGAGWESLIRKYLKAGVMNKGRYEATDIGTPQGGNLSPLLSNIMLNELDKELESRGQRFTRYADDVVIVLKSKAAATRVMYSITDWIERKLGLKVNTTKTKITLPSKLKYLGFGFWKNKEGWKARPHQNSVMKFKRQLKALCKRSWSIDLTYRIEKINEVTRGWINYFRIGSMKDRLREIDKHLRTMIRVIIWKQWKTAKKREWGLLKLGVEKWTAHNVANWGDHYQFVATKSVIKRAISKEILTKRGLISIFDYYQKVAHI